MDNLEALRCFFCGKELWVSDLDAFIVCSNCGKEYIVGSHSEMESDYPVGKIIDGIYRAPIEPRRSFFLIGELTNCDSILAQTEKEIDQLSKEINELKQSKDKLKKENPMPSEGWINILSIGLGICLIVAAILIFLYTINTGRIIILIFLIGLILVTIGYISIIPINKKKKIWEKKKIFDKTHQIEQKIKSNEFVLARKNEIKKDCIIANLEIYRRQLQEKNKS